MKTFEIGLEKIPFIQGTNPHGNLDRAFHNCLLNLASREQTIKWLSSLKGKEIYFKTHDTTSLLWEAKFMKLTHIRDRTYIFQIMLPPLSPDAFENINK